MDNANNQLELLKTRVEKNKIRLEELAIADISPKY